MRKKLAVLFIVAGILSVASAAMAHDHYDRRSSGHVYVGYTNGGLETGIWIRAPFPGRGDRHRDIRHERMRDRGHAKGRGGRHHRRGHGHYSRW
jgi:hypothetical protein